MPIEIYDVIVPTYSQILKGLVQTLEKGLAHCEEHGKDPEEFARFRLAPDMQPLSYQVLAAAHFSAGLVDTISSGSFTTPSRERLYTYAEMLDIARTAHASVLSLRPEDVNTHQQGVTFQTEKFTIKFTTFDFITNFALPNFFFHATTTYNILRLLGVKLIKLNYLGELRVSERTGI